MKELYHPQRLNTAHSNILPMVHADIKQATINPGFAYDFIGMTGSGQRKNIVASQRFFTKYLFH
ncbi:MAG: hypothetical protein AAB286_02430 [Pseudomonadota bacterium]